MENNSNCLCNKIRESHAEKEKKIKDKHKNVWMKAKTKSYPEIKKIEKKNEKSET